MAHLVSLDALVADPGLALGLSSEGRERVLLTIASLLIALGAGRQPDAPQPEPSDKLLTAEQAAQRTGLTVKQLKTRKLPFKRKLGHRTTRYSERGLERWMRRAAS